MNDLDVFAYRVALENVEMNCLKLADSLKLMLSAASHVAMDAALVAETHERMAGAANALRPVLDAHPALKTLLLAEVK